MSHDAVQRLASSFVGLSDEPGWLWSKRSEAIRNFEATGFPTTRLEEWKHTKLRPLVQPEWRVAAPGEPSRRKKLDVPQLDELIGSDGFGVVLVDGSFDSKRSKLGDLPEGVTVTSLRDAIRDRPELVEAYLGANSDAFSRAFVALNLAFFTDGVLVHVAAGVQVQAPIVIVVATTGKAKGQAQHLRNLVVAEQGASVTVVERFLGCDVDALNNVVTEVTTMGGAHVHHVKVQQEGAGTGHVATIDVSQHRDSRFTSHALATGGKVARTEVRCRLQQPGAECALFGLYLGRGDQQLDQLTHVEHAVPHGRSQQVYKGILDGKSSGVFNGMVLVQADAQQTDAVQSNKNLLLSDDADAHTRPQLEIHADDVKCAHGATVGQLDPEALFFLRSRGIAQHDARQMLTSAFASEVTATLEGDLQALFSEVVGSWMQ